MAWCLLEERTQDEKGDEHADEAEEGDVECDGAERELEDHEIDVERSERGRHTGREHLLHRTCRKKLARDLGERATDDEADGERHGVKHRSASDRTAGRSHGSSALTVHQRRSMT